MAEVMQGIAKILHDKGVPTGAAIALYSIPREILRHTIDIDYDKGKLLVKVPLGTLKEKFDSGLDKNEMPLLYIGRGAFTVSLSEKTYWCDDIPELFEEAFHSTMKELGYKCSNKPLIYPKIH